ncbi:MAG: hypothetical protein ACREP0_05145 [Rhodanobacteraceae bacterium]
MSGIIFAAYTAPATARGVIPLLLGRASDAAPTTRRWGASRW